MNQSSNEPNNEEPNEEPNNEWTYNLPAHRLPDERAGWRIVRASDPVSYTHLWAPFPYVILADGCSAAPDSDLGARLLALNARRLLPWFALPVADEVERVARHWRLGQRLIRRAARQARALGVDEDVLDATLIVAWCDGATVYVHLYGDGCICLLYTSRCV